MRRNTQKKHNPDVKRTTSEALLVQTSPLTHVLIGRADGQGAGRARYRGATREGKQKQTGDLHFGGVCMQRSKGGDEALRRGMAACGKKMFVFGLSSGWKHLFIHLIFYAANLSRLPFYAWLAVPCC